MSPIEEKILRMEKKMQERLDKLWKKPEYSIRHDFQSRSSHEHFARADLWNELLKEIKEFEPFGHSDKVK